MEDNMFELMTKMFGDLNKRFDKLEGRFDNLEGRFDNLEKEVKDIKKTVLNIEQDHGNKLKALFDGQKQHSDQLERIEREVSRHEEFILKRVK